jgi:hypothetical protein
LREPPKPAKLASANACVVRRRSPAYEPLPILTIGQLSLVEVARSVNMPFFSSLSICVSLVIRTGEALAFQVRTVSF